MRTPLWKIALPDLSDSYRFVSQKWSFGESIPALAVEVCDTTLLHFFWSQVIMGMLFSSWKKSRTSRVCITGCDFLPDRVNQASRWAVGRADRIHVSATKGCQPKSQLLCHKGCCLTAVKTSACNLIYLISFWENQVSMVRKTRVVWTCWMFLFLPMKPFNLSP